MNKLSEKVRTYAKARMLDIMDESIEPVTKTKLVDDPQVLQYMSAPAANRCLQDIIKTEEVIVIRKGKRQLFTTPRYPE